MYLLVSIFNYRPTKVLVKRPVSMNFCYSSYYFSEPESCLSANFFRPKSSTSVTILGSLLFTCSSLIYKRQIYYHKYLVKKQNKRDLNIQILLAVTMQILLIISYKLIFIMIKRMLKQFYKPLIRMGRNNMQFQFGMLKFNLPDLGEKIKEGTIKKLYVKQGDQVEQFQKLADVASDKQFTQITASDSGVIKKIHYKQEDICQVGSLFLQIQVLDSKSQPQQPKTPPIVPEPTISYSAKSDSSSSILATPYVRGLIKQKKLDITKIKGTGPNGRILQIDLLSSSQTREKISNKDQKSSKQKQFSSLPKQTIQKTVKMSNFERGMVKTMTESNKIPHLYLHEQFDITQTQKMRKTIKENKTKVTLMGILVKTFSLALKKYPIINSTYEPEKNEFEYTIQGSQNISIAIDSPNGLVVPNIKNVQQCNLVKIQQQLERLRILASQAKLTSKQLTQGTVCISNIGTIGGVSACPLILPPQVCIVAIGKMQVVPKYIGSELVKRTILTVSYGCDHRVIDGGTIARFSNEWKKVLENPYLALAEMS